MKEKRIGPDAIMNIISVISILSWVILGLIFLMTAIRNPTSSGMAASRPGLRGAGQWTISIIYIFLIFLTLVSISGIIFNMLRMKRKSDKLRLTPVFSLIMSIIGLILLNI